MNLQRPSDTAPWPPVLILILLATAGTFLLRLTPLESERPPPSGIGIETSIIQDREARLWQDPFAVLKKPADRGGCYVGSAQTGAVSTSIRLCPAGGSAGETDTQNGTKDLDWLRALIRQRGGQVDVIYALVPGGTWVGADEIRRRTRYALLAGANRRGFVPEDPEHLGVVEQRIETPLNPEAGWTVRLPFEWLISEEASRAALILWVDEETLGQAIAPSASSSLYFPLTRLSSLIDRVAEGLPDTVRHTIIGPYSSTFLVAAGLDPNRNQAVEILEKKPVVWYSPTATIPDDALRGLSGELPRFHRMIATDEKLAEALFSELQRRDIGGKGQAIALVGLWDTAYSRRLRKLVEQAVNPDDENGQAPAVWTASYLRGVDGRLPKGAGSTAEKDDKDGGKARSAAERIERPEGDAQIDYLRRLALDLRRRQREEGKRIMAIGVLGDDYHDMRLALAALRPSFPGAVFFTTDLNAAMLHPADNRFTRNLVVASAYDLSLKRDLQQDIPPFRYSYQTAQFLSAQVALIPDGERDGIAEALSAREGPACLRRAQLFEIGYTEAVLLDDGLSAGSHCGKRVDATIDPHRPLAPPPHRANALWLPAGVLLVGLLTTAMGLSWRRCAIHWGLAVVVAVILSCGFFRLLHHLPTDREPIVLLQGVSIWPSELLRLLALLIAVMLLVRGQRLLERMRLGVERVWPALGPGDGAGDDSEQPSIRSKASVIERVGRCVRSRQIVWIEAERAPAPRATCVRPAVRR